MANLNKITLIGRVGGEPEIRTFERGGKIGLCSLAVTERYKSSTGQIEEQATWFKLRFFGKSVDTIEKYLHKGDSLYVEGPHVQRDYTNKDGQKVTSWEVKVLNFQFLTQKSFSDAKQAQEFDDDMPC